MDTENLLEAIHDGNDEISESQSCAIPTAGNRNTVYMMRVDESTCRKDSSDCCSPQINVSSSVENLHLGTQLIFSGPVIIKGVTKDDILSVNSENSNANLDCKKHRNRKSIARKNMGLCVLSGFIFTLLYIIILFFCYENSTSKKEQTHYYSMDTLSRINGLMKIVKLRTWGLNDEKCQIQCATQKLKVRFAIGKSFWSDCFDNNEQCIRALEKELNRSLSLSQDDIYYNYIIGLSGNNNGSYIYEGRSLACQFIDKSQQNYANSIITVGIGDCFPTKDLLISREVDAIKYLLNYLMEYNVLIENYSVEFPAKCKKYLRRLGEYTQEKNGMSFYEDDVFNISSPLNQTITEILSFSESKHSVGKARLVKLQSNLSCNSIRKGKIVIKKLTIKYFLKTINETFSSYYECKNAHHLKDKIKNATEINYFMLLPSNYVCKNDTILCSKNFNITKEINIAVFQRSEYNEEADESIASFSNMLSLVVKNIKHNVSYEQVSIKISPEFDNIPFIKNYYEQLSIFHSSAETLNATHNNDSI